MLAAAAIGALVNTPEALVAAIAPAASVFGFAWDGSETLWLA